MDRCFFKRKIVLRPGIEPGSLWPQHNILAIRLPKDLLLNLNFMGAFLAIIVDYFTKNEEDMSDVQMESFHQWPNFQLTPYKLELKGEFSGENMVPDIHSTPYMLELKGEPTGEFVVDIFCCVCCRIDCVKLV